MTKLTGKDDLIRDYLQRNIPQTVIARLLNVNRLKRQPADLEELYYYQKADPVLMALFPRLERT